MAYDDCKFMKERFLDLLMAHILIAGGHKFDQEELREKTIGEVLDLIYPNNIRLEVKFEDNH